MFLSYRVSLRLFLCSVALSSTACASQSFVPAPAAAPAELAPLISAVSERLDIADQVALTKWDSGKAIQDSVREQQVIANAMKMAPDYKIDAGTVGTFMAAQIEANKLVQYVLLAKWHGLGKAPDIARPDLVKDIRPQLDVLQGRLLEGFAAFAPYRRDPACPTWLNQQRNTVSNDAIHYMALIRAVGGLCISADH